MMLSVFLNSIFRGGIPGQVSREPRSLAPCSPSGHSVLAVPRNRRYIVFIFVLFVTLSSRFPLSIVVFRWLTSWWSNPCRNSIGSASLIDTDTPFPDATGFSFSAEPSTPIPLLDPCAACNLASSPTTDCLGVLEPAVPLPNDTFDAMDCRLPSADNISAKLEGLIGSVGLVGLVGRPDSRCSDFLLLDVSSVDLGASPLDEVTNRKKRFALSLVPASFPKVDALPCRYDRVPGDVRTRRVSVEVRWLTTRRSCGRLRRVRK